MNIEIVEAGQCPGRLTDTKRDPETEADATGHFKIGIRFFLIYPHAVSCLPYIHILIIDKDH